MKACGTEVSIYNVDTQFLMHQPPPWAGIKAKTDFESVVIISKTFICCGLHRVMSQQSSLFSQQMGLDGTIIQVLCSRTEYCDN